MHAVRAQGETGVLAVEHWLRSGEPGSILGEMAEWGPAGTGQRACHAGERWGEVVWSALRGARIEPPG